MTAIKEFTADMQEAVSVFLTEVFPESHPFNGWLIDFLPVCGIIIEKEADFMIREITNNDLDGLMTLYMELHDNPFPEKDQRFMKIWNRIISDPDHHIIVADVDGIIAASCVCVIIPNLTRGQRPYAFIENVVTSAPYRRRGLASACLDFAKEIAVKENCYKMMLLTGSKEAGTLRFYENAGYNSSDKTAFIQWL